ATWKKRKKYGYQLKNLVKQYGRALMCALPNQEEEPPPVQCKACNPESVNQEGELHELRQCAQCVNYFCNSCEEMNLRGDTGICLDCYTGLCTYGPDGASGKISEILLKVVNELQKGSAWGNHALCNMPFGGVEPLIADAKALRARILPEAMVETSTVFCGHNGCGKTTLLNCLLRVGEAPASRYVEMNSDDPMSRVDLQAVTSAQSMMMDSTYHITGSPEAAQQQIVFPDEEVDADWGDEGEPGTGGDAWFGADGKLLDRHSGLIDSLAVSLEKMEQFADENTYDDFFEDLYLPTGSFNSTTKHMTRIRYSKLLHFSCTYRTEEEIFADLLSHPWEEMENRHTGKVPPELDQVEQTRHETLRELRKLCQSGSFKMNKAPWKAVLELPPDLKRVAGKVFVYMGRGESLTDDCAYIRHRLREIPTEETEGKNCWRILEDIKLFTNNIITEMGGELVDTPGLGDIEANSGSQMDLALDGATSVVVFLTDGRPLADDKEAREMLQDNRLLARQFQSLLRPGEKRLEQLTFLHIREKGKYVNLKKAGSNYTPIANKEREICQKTLATYQREMRKFFQSQDLEETSEVWIEHEQRRLNGETPALCCRPGLFRAVILRAAQVRNEDLTATAQEQQQLALAATKGLEMLTHITPSIPKLVMLDLRDYISYLHEQAANTHLNLEADQGLLDAANRVKENRWDKTKGRGVLKCISENVRDQFEAEQKALEYINRIFGGDNRREKGNMLLLLDEAAQNRLMKVLLHEVGGELVRMRKASMIETRHGSKFKASNFKTRLRRKLQVQPISEAIINALKENEHVSRLRSNAEAEFTHLVEQKGFELVQQALKPMLFGDVEVADADAHMATTWQFLHRDVYLERKTNEKPFQRLHNLFPLCNDVLESALREAVRKACVTEKKLLDVVTGFEAAERRLDEITTEDWESSPELETFIRSVFKNHSTNISKKWAAFESKLLRLGSDTDRYNGFFHTMTTFMKRLVATRAMHSVGEQEQELARTSLSGVMIDAAHELEAVLNRTIDDTLNKRRRRYLALHLKMLRIADADYSGYPIAALMVPGAQGCVPPSPIRVNGPVIGGVRELAALEMASQKCEIPLPNGRPWTLPGRLRAHPMVREMLGQVTNSEALLYTLIIARASDKLLADLDRTAMSLTVLRRTILKTLRVMTQAPADRVRMNELLGEDVNDVVESFQRAEDANPTEVEMNRARSGAWLMQLISNHFHCRVVVFARHSVESGKEVPLDERSKAVYPMFEILPWQLGEDVAPQLHYYFYYGRLHYARPNGPTNHMGPFCLQPLHHPRHVSIDPGTPEPKETTKAYRKQ
ncbi:unnamed protein product, partial [Chrysoparadoxa australica]